MSDNIRHTDAREWDVDSSTRQSVHPMTRYVPFEETLSTTAQTLVTAAATKPAVNLVKNPSIEGTNITEFTAVGSAISRSSAQAASGTNSLLVNPGNSAGGEGFYWSIPNVPYNIDVQYITVQAEVRGASASGDVAIMITDNEAVTASHTVLATSATTSLSTSFQRITATYAVPASTNTTQYLMKVLTVANHNIDFYVDKIMCEIRTDNSVSDYIDGGLGVNYSWAGAANLSTSKKKSDLIVIKGIKITNQHATIPVYVAFDTVASATTGIIVSGTDTFETGMPALDFRDKVSIVAASGTPVVHGVIWGSHI